MDPPAPPATASSSKQENAVPFDPTQEIRFAVVMYGGVSLAIYINGVTQELLNMARATAPRSADSATDDGKTALVGNDDAEILGTLGVYRKLGQHLRNPAKLREMAKPVDGKSPLPGKEEIRTRFIVDVISGTSAGGINGVFLAKALARNQKMDGLKKLWLQEGDLSKLLNDSFSVSDLTGYSVQKPQQSLLNSQRMYRKLLEALEEMEQGPSPQKQDPKSKESPLVGELDLFITTTDIEGIPLPIKLADNVVYERRYKNVFHFRYATTEATGSERDDFKRECDPFLAFAARCTSSFPFAFEPMRLADIDSVIEGYPRYRNTPESPEAWDAFFSEYLRLGLYDLDKKARGEPILGLPSDDKDKIKADIQKLRTAFRSRSFGDGGYLDNKPFSYATSMLMRRRADVHVERKLLYVEPSPEHPELVPTNRERPDFAENVRAALLDLPRQETIREDIARIDERNQMIERIAIFAKGMDKDLRTHREPPMSDSDFCEAGLEEMFGRYGIAYASYHRLRVEQTTQFLTDIVARIAGHDPDSDAAGAIKEIIEEWRLRKFSEEKDQPGKKTENLFLSEFDLDYRLRRLAFLSRRVNELGRTEANGKLDEKPIELLKAWKESSPTPVNVDLTALSSEWCDAFRQELNRIKKKVIGKALIDTRLAEEKLLRGADEPEDEGLSAKELAKKTGRDRIVYLAWNGDGNLSKKEIDKLQRDDRELYFATRLRALVDKFKLPWDRLEQLLEYDEPERGVAIQDLLDEPGRMETLQMLRENVSAAFKSRASADLAADLKALANEPLDPPKPQTAEQLDARSIARDCLLHYYNNFTYYDLVTYPVLYGTGVGEANAVEIFRISPEDATSIIEERAVGETRRKLAGTALMSFGAFIDHGWRKNDMLWGRLDGAERLITALLPPTPGKCDENKETRDNLIKEAHIAILREEIHEGDIGTLRLLLSNMLARVQPSSVQERKLREVVDAALIQERKNLPAAFESALRECLKDPEEIWTYYKKQFEVNRRFDPENALRLISRATNVTGRMLEGLADQIGADPAKRTAQWIARFGVVFWGLVTVAVPQSLGNLFVRHWLGLIYVLSFITIVLGVIFPGTPIKELGWASLGIAAGLNLVIYLLGDFIAGRRGWLRVLGTLVVLVIAALVGLGVIFISDLLSSPKHWNLFVVQNHLDRVLAGAIAGILLMAFTLKQWKKGLHDFIAAPHSSFHIPRRVVLTAATLAIGCWLMQIGPANIADFEFAGDISRARELARKLVPDWQPRIAEELPSGAVSQLRRQLVVDYLFILAYVTMLASYCVAAAKVLWQSITRLRDRLRTKAIEAEKEAEIARRQRIDAEKHAQPEQLAVAQPQVEQAQAEIQEPKTPIWVLSLLTRVSHWVVVVGFSLAALQCVAGFADAVENAGLLWFLSNPTIQAGLTISLYCATLKFGLVGLGAVYSTVGFFVGIFQSYDRVPVDWKEACYRFWRRVAMAFFGGGSGYVAFFAFNTLWKHPAGLQNLFANLFALFL